MELLLCFLLAIACPWIGRIKAAGWQSSLGWILAVLPFGLFLRFLFLIPTISHHPLTQSYAWLPQLGVQLSFYVDGLSNLFAIAITGIGTLVVIYSGAYLKNHPQIGRFYAYLFFFMGSMLGIVVSDNLIALFVFWELTTISSFLLISFNHEKVSARNAALQGLLVTASGGLVMLVGFIALGLVGHSLNISLLSRTDLLQSHAAYVVIVLLILIGAFTKSAQFPFHFWLPNAMEAPTPVSAYLHSATMVQAGVYLVARLTPALGHTPLWYSLLTLFGGATMLIGSVLALRATDIKQLLAYSTIASLGLLFFLLASGKPAYVNAAMLFFFAHALYKAGLFLSAGNIDHATGTRDIRKLGGLLKPLPLTFIAVLVCAASMAGLPPLLGFVSKEIIYEAKLNQAHVLELILLAVAIITNITFATLSAILVFKPFFGKQKEYSHQPHEIGIGSYVPVLCLAGLSLLFGIMPYAIDSRLIYPAVNSIVTLGNTARLALWHGVTPSFVISVVSLIIAAVIYLNYRRVFACLKRLTFIDKIGPEKLFAQKLNIIKTIAKLLTKTVQSGYSTRYLAIILSFTTLMLAATLLWLPNWHIAHIIPQHAAWFDWFLVALIVCSSLAILLGISHLAAIVCLGVIGLGVTLIFLINGAPDVAMTQLLVDILTVVIFVLALYRLPKIPHAIGSTRSATVRNAIIAIVCGIVVTTLMLSVISTPFNNILSAYYGKHAFVSAHGRNIVNVILVDFRAMDTFGEILVVALAGLGVFSLLHVKAKKS
jgi:multicomponent Na+:H+ antiporter subunit A